MSEQVKNQCFVISAIGKPSTAIREEADLVFHLLIEPAINRLGMRALRADHTPNAGSIISQMHNDISNSAFCIAVLSNNPNVLYEIGFALALKKLVIVLKRPDDASMPFDIHHLRTVHYSLAVREFDNIVSQLVEAIERARLANWLDLDTQNAIYGRKDALRKIYFTGGRVDEGCRLTPQSVWLDDPDKKWKYVMQPGVITLAGQRAYLLHELHIDTREGDLNVVVEGEGVCQGDSMFIHYHVRSQNGDGVGWQGTQVVRGLEVAGNLFGCYMATNYSRDFEVSVGRFELFRKSELK